MSRAGIDVTRGHTILLELTRTGLLYRLGRTAILPGFDHNPEKPARSYASSELARGLGTVPSSLRKRGAFVSLSGRDVIYRITDVGAGDPVAIRALVNLEVDELTGGGTPMLAAHQMIEPPGGGQMAMIGVAREALVEHYYSSLRATGICSDSFVPGPIALYHCYLMSGDLDAEGVQMLASISESSTDIILVEQGGLLLARTLRIGVSDFVDLVGSELGVNREQARETLFTRINIKPGVAGDNISGERAVSAAQDVAAQLYAQLSGIVGFGRGQLRLSSLEINRVVLCGAGASIRGLRSFMKSRFHKPVETLNPLAGVDTSELGPEALQMIEQYTSALAIPLGLAKMAADGEGAHIVFTPGSARSRQTFLNRSVWSYAGVLVVVAALVFSLVISGQVKSESAATAKAANAEAASYSPFHGDLKKNKVRGEDMEARLHGLSELNRDLITARQRLYELAEARRSGTDAIGFFSYLQKKTPPEVLFTSFSSKVLLKGDSTEARGVRLEVFIESAGRPANEVYEELTEIIKRYSLVDPEGVQPSALTEVADGSGQTAWYEIFFRDSMEIIEPGGEVK